MAFERIGLQHESAFLTMVRDYEKSDPESLIHFFGGIKKWDASRFKKFVGESEKATLDWRPAAKAVSVTRYVLLDEKEGILGNGLMRFPLDEKTEIEGGNLEFSIPPAFRGRDCEAYTLNGLLFEAVRAGMARALVTCCEEDSIRRSAIERNRGLLENIVESKVHPKTKIARYWIRFR